MPEPVRTRLRWRLLLKIAPWLSCRPILLRFSQTCALLSACLILTALAAASVSRWTEERGGVEEDDIVRNRLRHVQQQHDRLTRKIKLRDSSPVSQMSDGRGFVACLTRHAFAAALGVRKERGGVEEREVVIIRSFLNLELDSSSPWQKKIYIYSRSTASAAASGGPEGDG